MIYNGFLGIKVKDGFTKYLRFNKMITISERAVKELKIAIEEHKSKNPDVSEMYVRIGVKGGGCSGYQYTLVLEESKNPKDQLININDIEIVVDQRSALYLEGTNLDFVDELNNRGFKFNNPSVIRTCGCGQSFSM